MTLSYLLTTLWQKRLVFFEHKPLTFQKTLIHGVRSKEKNRTARCSRQTALIWRSVSSATCLWLSWNLNPNYSNVQIQFVSCIKSGQSFCTDLTCSRKFCLTSGTYLNKRTFSITEIYAIYTTKSSSYMEPCHRKNDSCGINSLIVSISLTENQVYVQTGSTLQAQFLTVV